MQKNSSIIVTLKVDFSYDDSDSLYGQAAMKALQKALASSFPESEDKVRIDSVSAFDTACGKTLIVVDNLKEEKL